MQFIALINGVTKFTTMGANWLILPFIPIVTNIIDPRIALKFCDLAIKVADSTLVLEQ